MTIDTILEHLDMVRGRNGKYQARCPAHDDKDPSLSISETSNGTVLVKCFAGCTADEIVGSIGLELKALFPPSDMTDSQKRAYRTKQSTAKIEDALWHELIVMEQIISSRVCDRKLVANEAFRRQNPGWRPIPFEHWDREILAAARIRKSLGELYD